MKKIILIISSIILIIIIILVVVYYKEYKIKYNSYLFLGDSITYGYPLKESFKGYPTNKSGVCGYTTQDILNNMDSMVYSYNPSKVFLLIGINDISSNKNKDYIINNIKKIVDNIKNFDNNIEIYIESIYPVNSNLRRDIDNNKIIEVNTYIEDLCNKEDLHYIDIYNLLIDDNNNLKRKYTMDGIHLTNDAYKVVTKELIKYL